MIFISVLNHGTFMTATYLSIASSIDTPGHFSVLIITFVKLTWMREVTDEMTKLYHKD